LKPLRQAEVALLHDVEEGQARRLVLLRDRHDQPQVRVHELAVSLFAAADQTAELAALGGRQLLGGLELCVRGDTRLDRLGEADLIILGQEVVASDILEVETYEILVVSVLTAGLDVLGGHVVPSGLAVGQVLRVGGVLADTRSRVLSADPERRSSTGQNVRCEAHVPRYTRKQAAPAVWAGDEREIGVKNGGRA
jgi:hypothetical protein